MKRFTFGLLVFLLLAPPAHAAYRLGDYRARPPIHRFGGASKTPRGLSPDAIKIIYRLPKTGGHGTIALIGAYDDATIEHDLAVFSSQFKLPACTAANGCFEKHLMAKGAKTDGGWALETSLDVEWAHAIAPQAKILLVEAKTPSGTNLLAALDYARSRSDVVAVSMSWGGAEFPDEAHLENHFTSAAGAAFFASSGDNGWGASWPAASARVVAVGGTSLTLASGSKAETAWDGSGGGVSAFIPEPAYQSDYSIPRAKGKRAIPDVSYNANPRSGYAVYATSAGRAGKGWQVVGGTSAGAPQWAAIQSLGLSASNEKFYADKAKSEHQSYFRDIQSGTNGDCGYYCAARKRYDYVTGLGSPLTVHF